jgi:hypothetical protein
VWHVGPSYIRACGQVWTLKREYLRSLGLGADSLALLDGPRAPRPAPSAPIQPLRIRLNSNPLPPPLVDSTPAPAPPPPYAPRHTITRCSTARSDSSPARTLT